MAPRRPHRATPPAETPEQVLFVASQPAPGEVVHIVGSEAQHARKSLRVRSADRIHLVDGRGHRYHGSVTVVGKDGIAVAVEGVEAIPEWPVRTIWLGAGVLRSTRMDFIIEKASELGVRRLVPLLLTHCVARPSEAGAKLDRWRRLAVESLKQSKRARLMEMGDPSSLEGFLEGLPPEHTLWVADPEGEAPAGAAAATGPGPVVLVVGPEGGLTPDERSILADRGARFVLLGGHRLRSETAALTLLTAALAALGEMAPGRGQELH